MLKWFNSDNNRVDDTNTGLEWNQGWTSPSCFPCFETGVSNLFHNQMTLSSAECSMGQVARLKPGCLVSVQVQQEISDVGFHSQARRYSPFQIASQ